MPAAAEIILHTKNWIRNVVVGCNFCPFAARAINNNSLHYAVETTATRKQAVAAFQTFCQLLDKEAGIETGFLLFSPGFSNFKDYLGLLAQCEQSLVKNGYEGIYQIASFHPQYFFSGASFNDPANFTNRSPYPMLQLLREESISRSLANYPDPGQIPKRNAQFARERGLAYMKTLSALSFDASS